MNEPASCIKSSLYGTALLAEFVANTMAVEIGVYALHVLDTLKSGGKLLFCGNGGSAADAQHIAAEYVVRFKRDRRPLPAIALTTDTSVLTACANDFGYSRVFAQQVEAIAAPGDLLVMHSTSGESENLIEAAHTAERMGVGTAALLANEGGGLLQVVKLPLVVPTDSVARAQEIHMAIEHAVADWVDATWQTTSS